MTRHPHTGASTGTLTKSRAVLADNREDRGMDTTRESVEGPVYLIRKRGAYYRPNSQGYTLSEIQAGRYSLSDAIKITHPNGPDGPRDEMTYIHEDDLKCPDWIAYRALLTRAEAAEGALERDRSHVATALTAFSDAFARRSWLLEGRGSYEWDDPQYQKEFGAAYEELGAALEPLKTIARDWSNCPKTQEEVQAARMDWKARAEAAEAERDALQAKLALAVAFIEDLEGCEWPINAQAKRILATLTADTIPAPRIEGWNAAIEAAAKLLRHYAVEKGNTKTGNGRTAIFYARKVEAIPCPYQPKEVKDDDL